MQGFGQARPDNLLMLKKGIAFGALVHFYTMSMCIWNPVIDKGAGPICGSRGGPFRGFGLSDTVCHPIIFLGQFHGNLNTPMDP